MKLNRMFLFWSTNYTFLFLCVLQFLCRLRAIQPGHAVQILLQTQQEAQGKRQGSANYTHDVQLQSGAQFTHLLSWHKALWCKLVDCIVWIFDISITHAEMWHFFVMSVLHHVQKEIGPLHQLRPKEESQWCGSHWLLRCKYLFIHPFVQQTL